MVRTHSYWRRLSQSSRVRLCARYRFLAILGQTRLGQNAVVYDTVYDTVYNMQPPYRATIRHYTVSMQYTFVYYMFSPYSSTHSVRAFLSASGERGPKGSASAFYSICYGDRQQVQPPIQMYLHHTVTDLLLPLVLGNAGTSFEDVFATLARLLRDTHILSRLARVLLDPMPVALLKSKTRVLHPLSHMHTSRVRPHSLLPLYIGDVV